MEMMPLRRCLADRNGSTSNGSSTMDEDRTEVMDRLLDVLASLKGVTTMTDYATILHGLNTTFTLEQAFQVSHNMLLDKELAFMKPKLEKYTTELMQMFIKS
jgi:hypothetical protein